jgi:putative transcriptional regulator
MRFGWSWELLVGAHCSPMRAARMWAGLSQADLAAIVGSSRDTISVLERGASIPSVTLALAIAGALDTTVEELFAAGELR